MDLVKGKLCCNWIKSRQKWVVTSNEDALSSWENVSFSEGEQENEVNSLWLKRTTNIGRVHITTSILVDSAERQRSKLKGSLNTLFRCFTFISRSRYVAPIKF
jgi:hypothetical protein